MNANIIYDQIIKILLIITIGSNILSVMRMLIYVKSKSWRVGRKRACKVVNIDLSNFIKFDLFFISIQ